MIENAAFLVKVEGPDGLTTEYDYYPWGDLKSIRTIHGGIIKYTWKYWVGATTHTEQFGGVDTTAATGIKVISRQVTPRPGDAHLEPYVWQFEKNELPEKLDGVDIYDQDRTIVTLPSGNEMVYRFNNLGLVRNIKTYVGRGLRWTQGVQHATESNIASPPDGRLVQEVERWTEWGNEGFATSGLVKKSPSGPGTACLTQCSSTSPRVAREETYYLDDPIGGAPVTDLAQDWRYDILGTTFVFDSAGTLKTARQAFSHSVWALEGWQKLRGYTREIVEGSAVGFRRVKERKFSDPDNLTPEEAAAENVNFRWPVAFVRETQISGPSGAQQIAESLTEFQYSTTQLHKVVKMIQRKAPASITPHDHPYAAPANALPGDVVASYELWPARSLSAALPTTPTPTAYGLVSRVTRSGGDPVTTVEGAPGNSGKIYDETISYKYGVPYQRQFTDPDVNWKSLDAEADPSGHVILSTDTAGVATALNYDAAGDLIKASPPAINGVEHPLHVEKDIRPMAPRDDEHHFLGGVKLFARTAWRGQDGADYRTSLEAAYLRLDLDGLGRTVRLERKLEDGSRVKKSLEYGAPGGLASGRWGLDRLTREEEWAAEAATNVPATTIALTVQGTGDQMMDNRPDPFERQWRLNFPDSAIRLIRHFGTNHAETAQGIKGVNGSGADLDLTATTTYYKDAFGRARVVDGPSGSADATYEYDLFGNVKRAVTLSNPAQLAPTMDGSGISTDRFTVADQSGQERLFMADPLGRIRTITNPENGTVHFHSYDPAGNLLLSDDENGVILRRTYDAAARFSRIEWCQPVLPSIECETTTPGRILNELVYHNSVTIPARGRSLGKLLTLKASDDAGALLSQQELYFEGLNGRLSEERSAFRDWRPGDTIEGGTSPYYAVKYTYQPDGRIGSTTYPHPVGSPSSAALASYSYAHGLPSMVASDRSLSAFFKYHPSGLLREIYHSSGARTVIGADARSRVASIDVLTSGGASLWHTGAHRYDGAGNLHEIGDTAPSFPADDFWKFRYDESQRLIRAKVAGYEISHAYDLYGNMTSQSFIQAPSPPPPGMSFSSRQHTDNKVQDPSYAYDPNGDLRDAEGLAFDYDVRSRMTAPGTVDGDGQLVPRALYRYSGLGLRSSKDDKTAEWTTFYFRDLAGEVLSEYSRPNAGGAPGWSRDYFYGAGLHVGVTENGPPSAAGSFVSCAQAGSRTCGQTAGTQAITLDWASNIDSDIYGYRVYRGTSADQFSSGSTQPPTRVHSGEVLSSFFSDTTIKSCPAETTQYCWYAVTAVDRSGKEGPYSSPLAIQLDDTVPPGAPRQPRVDGTSATTAFISWSPPIGTLPIDFLGYYVYRSLTPSNPSAQQLNQVPMSGTSFNDVGLLCATTYYYRIASTDTAQNVSIHTSEITATTGACSSGSSDGNKKRTQLGPEGFPSEDADPVRIAGIAVATETGGAEPMHTDGFAASPHQVVGQTAGDWVAYALHTDHLGSIRLVTNIGEQVVARHRYFPFGQEIGPIPKSPSTHRYIGREWDPESGMLYLMARYGRPQAGGRFATTDPLAGSAWRPASLNRYAYSLNSPLRYLDPYGLTECVDATHCKEKIQVFAIASGTDVPIAFGGGGGVAGTDTTSSLRPKTAGSPMGSDTTATPSTGSTAAPTTSTGVGDAGGGAGDATTFEFTIMYLSVYSRTFFENWDGNAAFLIAGIVGTQWTVEQVGLYTAGTPLFGPATIGTEVIGIGGTVGTVLYANHLQTMQVINSANNSQSP